MLRRVAANARLLNPEVLLVAAACRADTVTIATRVIFFRFVAERRGVRSQPVRCCLRKLYPPLSSPGSCWQSMVREVDSACASGHKLRYSVHHLGS